MVAENPERALYEFIADLRIDDLGERVRSACEAVILDHFACALVGIDLPWTRALRSAMAAGTGLAATPTDVLPAWGTAHIYGSDEQASPFVAALVNGTATHGIDVDDLYLPAMSHPGCIVNPATFALADALDSPGDELLVSVASGYEVMCRVGQATGITGGNLGLHATGQQGPIGAAAASSRLTGADADAIESAVGLSVSFGSGIKAFQTGPGMIKRLHAGRAASSGLFATHLVRHGFDGPQESLSSRYGFVNVFAMGGPTDVDALSRDLGRRFAVEDIYLKPYPACGALHGALAAVEQLVSDHRIDPARVKHVTVGTSKRAAEQNSIPSPTDVLSAQYSMEYSVALGLLGQSRDGRKFLVANTDQDGPARALARRVSVHVDDRAEAAFPQSNEADVHVELDDGTGYDMYGQCDQTSSSGWDVAETKFRLLTQDVLSDSSARELVRAVRALGSGGSARDCLDSIVLAERRSTHNAEESAAE